MEVQPATLPQIQKGRRGRVVFIDNDALGVAKQLREIDSNLRLAWNEFGEYFVVYQQLDDGTEHLVTTAQEADGRLVKRVQKIASRFYNYAEELDKQDKETDRKSEYKSSEYVGELAEELAHAIRKDTSTPRTDINRHGPKSKVSQPVQHKKQNKED